MSIQFVSCMLETSQVQPKALERSQLLSSMKYHNLNFSKLMFL